MRKAVFLDRDGVINQKAAEHEYIRDWDGFRFLPGAADAIRLLNQNSFLVLVVTNQRGIARGILNLESLQRLHSQMCAELAASGARIDGIFVCPHEEGTCNCRKPQIGLFRQAENRFPIDKKRSWMIGDSESDIQAGQKYGIKTIRIGDGQTAAEFRGGSLLEAVRILLEEDR